MLGKGSNQQQHEAAPDVRGTWLVAGISLEPQGTGG